MVVHNHKVQAVQNRFNGVEGALAAAKPVLLVPSRLSVDVVDGGVDFVGLPDGPLERAACHGVRAQQDVETVPCSRVSMDRAGIRPNGMFLPLLSG